LQYHTFRMLLKVVCRTASSYVGFFMSATARRQLLLRVPIFTRL
jgi:hypothetical protein